METERHCSDVKSECGRELQRASERVSERGTGEDRAFKLDRDAAQGRYLFSLVLQPACFPIFITDFLLIFLLLTPTISLSLSCQSDAEQKGRQRRREQ
jgi:hypothetical protein